MYQSFRILGSKVCWAGVSCVSSQDFGYLKLLHEALRNRYMKLMLGTFFVKNESGCSDILPSMKMVFIFSCGGLPSCWQACRTASSNIRCFSREWLALSDDSSRKVGPMKGNCPPNGSEIKLSISLSSLSSLSLLRSPTLLSCVSFVLLYQTKGS